MIGKVIGVCHACGLPLSSSDRPEPGYALALMHGPVIGAELGPNGETGCAAFDELDAPESYLVYMAKCQEATHRRRMS